MSLISGVTLEILVERGSVMPFQTSAVTEGRLVYLSSCRSASLTARPMMHAPSTAASAHACVSIKVFSIDRKGRNQMNT